MGCKATGVHLGRRVISNRIIPGFYHHKRESQKGPTGETKDSLDTVVNSKCSRNPFLSFINWQFHSTTWTRLIYYVEGRRISLRNRSPVALPCICLLSTTRNFSAAISSLTIWSRSTRLATSGAVSDMNLIARAICEWHGWKNVQLALMIAYLVGCRLSGAEHS